MKGYLASPIKKWPSKSSYLKELYAYCEKKGYTYEGPTANKTLIGYFEKNIQALLETKKDVSYEIIGLDKEDKQRVAIHWAIEYDNVWFNTYAENVQISNYDDKAKDFIKDFFGATEFTEM